jgi:predicted nucleic acid-binding protein
VIVLDTSILSHALRRRGPATETRETAVLRRLLAANVPAAVPGVVLQEVLSGVRSPVQFRELRRALEHFELLLAAREHHVAAAEISNACRSRGVAAGLADCLIAALTIGARGALFTTDGDFLQIAEHSALTLLDLDRISPDRGQS